MNPLLVITDLDKRFGRRTVLEKFSLSVAAGESIAITGPSGAGKSTLLSIVGLLETPTSGRITLRGTSLPGVNTRQATLLRRNHINYLFQSFALIGSSTALDNVLIGLHGVRLRTAEKKRRSRELLDRLGLDQVMDQRVSTLSGGEQQRVALARCLLKPGELILADEPTGALDDALADVAVDEMLTLQREFGKTLMIVTHDARVAERCDRAVGLTAPRPDQG